MSPISKSSAVSFVGAILFLASAFAAGANTHGSVVDAPKNGQSGGKLASPASRARDSASDRQQQPHSNTKPDGPKTEEQKPPQLEQPARISDQQVQELSQQVQDLSQQVRKLDQRIDVSELVAIIISLVIFILFIFLNRKHRARDSYYAIQSKIASLTSDVKSVQRDYQALLGSLRRELSNFVTAEAFDSTRRAIERLQAERPLPATSYRAPAAHTQFADPEDRKSVV